MISSLRFTRRLSIVHGSASFRLRFRGIALYPEPKPLHCIFPSNAKSRPQDVMLCNIPALQFSGSCSLLSNLQEVTSKRGVDQVEYIPLWGSFPPVTQPPKPESKRPLSSTTPETLPQDPKEDKKKNQLSKPSLWQKVKNEVTHYYHGFRLLGLEVKIASGICLRLLVGHTLTRRERKQLVRTVADIVRLVPFAVFIIVPFMELLLPFYLKFFPFMLPSTFKEKSSETEKVQQKLKAKLEMTRFLQETLIQTTGSSKGDANAPTVAEFQSFLKKVQESGEPASNEDIVRFSKLFEDRVTLESLDNKQLKMLCRILSLSTIGPSHLLRFQIWMRVRHLKSEDRLIAKEGVDKIPPWELQSLCQDRGMRSIGLSEDRLRSQLSEWLALHLNKNVPITLLLFSRALHITQASVDALPLQQAIAQLPPSASEEATARVLESTPLTDLDPRTKIQVLKKEQANIKAQRAQRRQELVEQQKAEAEIAKTSSEQLVDKAPVLKGTPDEGALDKVESTPSLVIEEVKVAKPTKIIPQPEELVDQAPIIDQQPRTEVVTEPAVPDLVLKTDQIHDQTSTKLKDEETEITIKDLADIESAIANSTNALEEEALHGLKEEVAETAKLQQKHQAVLVASEQVIDKRVSKAASRLDARVNRLIKDMDTMVDKLSEERKQLLKEIELREVHVKNLSEPEVKTEILDAIKADQDRVVDINDLLLALRRIQKAPDDARWQKILQVLDEDHDGKIELQHVLSVIELLGAENAKLSSKEIKRVLEMIDNEQLADAMDHSSETEQTNLDLKPRSDDIASSNQDDKPGSSTNSTSSKPSIPLPDTTKSNSGRDSEHMSKF